SPAIGFTLIFVERDQGLRTEFLRRGIFPTRKQRAGKFLIVADPRTAQLTIDQLCAKRVIATVDFDGKREVVGAEFSIAFVLLFRTRDLHDPVMLRQTD